MYRSSFGDFATKYAKDERFKNIEKMRERESLFNEYILEVRKREKEEKVQKRDQVMQYCTYKLRSNFLLQVLKYLVCTHGWFKHLSKLQAKFKIEKKI